MGLRLDIVLVLLLCLHHTRFAVFGASIKRDGIQFSNNSGDTDVGLSADVKGPEQCRTIPEAILSTVLGPAFNARYMSIIDPRESVQSEPTVSGVVKRKINKIPSFYVDEEYNSVYSNAPAWDFEFSNIKYEEELPASNPNTEENMSEDRNREIRHVKKNTPWQCNAKVEWIDLGNDYFPRFLRILECEKTNCWYGFYTCKPKSFTVKMLRRYTGVCIPSPSLNVASTPTNIDDSSSSDEPRELWVWEERAVNFCCECVVTAP
ncbi:protein trunk [Diprion similis]|uniref:protein trunk n=1 Tax=Diprion similis TaxID=362088 RepID=UPI001EF9ABBE|nr:protein trunk [Diprion similis]